MSRSYVNKHWLLISCASNFSSNAAFTKHYFSCRVVNAIFEVVAAVNMKNPVFSGAIPYSLVEMYRRFGKHCFLIFHLEE
jgi:hypothetical protein